MQDFDFDAYLRDDFPKGIDAMTVSNLYIMENGLMVAGFKPLKRKHKKTPGKNHLDYPMQLTPTEIGGERRLTFQPIDGVTTGMMWVHYQGVTLETPMADWLKEAYITLAKINYGLTPEGYDAYRAWREERAVEYAKPSPEEEAKMLEELQQKVSEINLPAPNATGEPNADRDEEQ